MMQDSAIRVGRWVACTDSLAKMVFFDSMFAAKT